MFKFSTYLDIGHFLLDIHIQCVTANRFKIVPFSF